MLYMGAYLAVGWHLMTRMDETGTLKVCGYESLYRFNGDRKEAAPAIAITFRKTNQDDPYKAKIYRCRLCWNPRLYNLKPVERLEQSRALVKSVNRVDASPSDWLFPTVSSTGQFDVRAQLA